MTTTFLANLSHYIPELLAVATMLGLLLIEAAYNRDDKGRHFVYFGSLIGLIPTLAMLISNLSLKPTAIFTNAVVIDPFSTLMKIVMVLGTLGTIHLSLFSKDIDEKMKSEFIILSIGVLVGGMFLASANNLLTIYLGIEILSILSYVMASLNKTDGKSTEAGLKYALYGGISAGLMLFGASHIYGVLGTIQFTGIVEKIAALSSTQVWILMPSFLLFFVGLGYKIACVPFHMWSPDVYEGSPIPVTTFFAIVPKMAGIAVLVRISMVFFSDSSALQVSWVGTLQIVAALTITVGNILAIGQKSVKRMLAYSSISHAGMMLLGVIVINQIGSSSVLFYGITYLFMTLVGFSITSYLSDLYGNDRFDIFNGLIKKYPVVTIIMAITMFSLAGVPPFSGFVAKFNVIAAVIDSKYYGLAIIAALNSVISLYYYMRIVRNMVFNPLESEERAEGLSFINQALLAGLCVPVVFLGIFWESIFGIAQKAVVFIVS